MSNRAAIRVECPVCRRRVKVDYVDDIDKRTKCYCPECGEHFFLSGWEVFSLKRRKRRLAKEDEKARDAEVKAWRQALTEQKAARSSGENVVRDEQARRGATHQPKAQSSGSATGGSSEPANEGGCHMDTQSPMSSIVKAIIGVALIGALVAVAFLVHSKLDRDAQRDAEREAERARQVRQLISEVEAERAARIDRIKSETQKRIDQIKQKLAEQQDQIMADAGRHSGDVLMDAIRIDQLERSAQERIDNLKEELERRIYDIEEECEERIRDIRRAE